MPRPIYAGQTLLRDIDEPVEGRLVTLDGRSFYKISNFDRLRPFFMSIVGSSDHWMFLSSTGGLTAGRKNAGNALFPYYTDDKIHEAHETTGSKTLLLVESDGKTFLWEPFSSRHASVYDIQRNLFKSTLGNQIRFQEINRDLGLTFEYEWANSDAFGFVKTSIVRNDDDRSASVSVLDGIQNLLPYGVNRDMQTGLSTLLDAYKKNELLEETGLGIYVLSSIPVDKPEPSEALKATTVWSVGLAPAVRLLSSLQLDAFRTGKVLAQEIDVRAERGAYFQQADLLLEAGEEQTWYTVAEVNQGPADIAFLRSKLEDKLQLAEDVRRDIDHGSEHLLNIIASADGLQHTQDELTCARHLSNTLFNVMRGGLFVDNYTINRSDLQDFMQSWNSTVAKRNEALISALPPTFNIDELFDRVEAAGDRQLERLCYEYLPLTFSRRHGDPSRPWNQFSIETRREDGSENLHFEGNWRDIFQNWEALALSYPGFAESMICKFVNASTADGYNPYRISRHGIDWEIIDPRDPWSYIGYWGDHQLIYLLKLLELSRQHHPEALDRFLSRSIFSFANVPYRIKNYRDLLADPHDTIDFDQGLHERISERAQSIGSDGKLVSDDSGEVYQVNLTEKLLISILAKMANLVPEAGIWMNTQRPEWNDANNALVGNGVSVVTLCYLRRYLRFCVDLLAEHQNDIDLSTEVAEWLNGISKTLARFEPLLSNPLSDLDRKNILDELGTVAGTYRSAIYGRGFESETSSFSPATITHFLELSLDFVDHSIRANRREDGLYHAYNLMTVTPQEGVEVGRLYEMLEGQVAVLSSGVLSATESVEVLDALRASSMYRSDQHSYMLYPDRTLPRFIEKNNIPGAFIVSSQLLKTLIEKGDRHIVEKDLRGGHHFNGSFRNKQDLNAALDRLGEQEYATEVELERASITGLFDEMFNHRSYTGRSGTFYGYEGLGSIYWHMVSKLLLAVGEVYHRACDSAEPDAVIERLKKHYYEIRLGIGTEKNPADYGAFPIDPYSHTPGTAGAQQPGMTGQVKEDIISRWAEFGVVVSEGCLTFQPSLLRGREFMASTSSFEYIDVNGRKASIDVPGNALAFTYCQVPILYRLSDRPGIVIELDGETREVEGLRISRELSAELFERTGVIKSVLVSLVRQH